MVKKHWSFLFCSFNFCLIFIVILILIAFGLSLFSQDPNHINRFGNFITLVGVWMSMRGTFREELKKERNLNDESPVINNKQLNFVWLNNQIFRQGDAFNKVCGLIFVFIGAIMASYGDYIFNFLMR